MTTLISRNDTLVKVEIEAGEEYSEPFNWGAFSMGSILVPAAWTAAGIAFVIGDLHKVCKLEDGTIIEIVAPDNTGYFRIPLDLASFASKGLSGQDFRLWSQTAGVGVNQVSTVEVEIRMKG